MKIGIVTGFLYPYAKSGPAVVTYNLANCLAKKNEVIVFGAIPQKDFSNEIEKYYPKVELRLHIEKSTFSLFSSQFKYLKQIDLNSLDILHFEILPGARGFLLLPFLRILNKNIKIIQKIHGWPPTELEYRFDKYFEKILYKLHWKISKINIQKYCNSIIVNSNFMKNIAKNELHNYIEVIPNGVDLDTWKPTKDNITLEGDKNIVFWGRFSKEKGVDLVVKSAKSILKVFPNTHFYLIGDGSLFEFLKKLTKKLKLEKNIHFTGFLPSKEIIKYASSADIAVFPSRYEPFGMMVLEAMALKKPIIATNVGGIKEIIQNYENGILVNPNVNEISKAVINLLKNDKLQGMLSIKAYETSKRYGWNKVCERYIEHYNQLSVSKNER